MDPNQEPRPSEPSTEADVPSTEAEAEQADRATEAERSTGAIDPVVFGVSFGLIAVFCLVGTLWSNQVGAIASTALDWIIQNVGWLFILTATGFIAFAVVLAFSRYGQVPPAQEGEEPEFSTVSWVAMMFSAGMGIGLMFFGIYEPVTHLATPPPGTNVEAEHPRPPSRAWLTRCSTGVCIRGRFTRSWRSHWPIPRSASGAAT